MGKLPRPDAFLVAMTQIRFNTGTYAGFAEPSGIVINPLDWMNIRLTKTPTETTSGFARRGRTGDPVGDAVVETPVIAQGTQPGRRFPGLQPHQPSAGSRHRDRLAERRLLPQPGDSARGFPPLAGNLPRRGVLHRYGPISPQPGRV